MNDAPDNVNELKNLRFLRILVTVLTLTMIGGVVTIIALIVIRIPTAISTTPVETALPTEITLPDGIVATAFTRGVDWYAIVTDDGKILIYNLDDLSLRQTIEIAPR